MTQAKVIADLEPLRVSEHARVEVRIIESRSGRRLDVRECVAGIGYTRRGLSLSVAEVDALFAQRDAIFRLLRVGVAVSPSQETAA